MIFRHSNSSALSVTHPSLEGYLATVQRQDNSFIWSESRNGMPVVFWEDTDGKRIPLCSTYDPMKETETLARSLYAPHKKLFFIIGFGVGYHVAQLHALLQPDQRICVIELSPSLFCGALERVDMSGWIGDKRLHFIVSPDRHIVSEKLAWYINQSLPYENIRLTYECYSWYERWSRYRTCAHELHSFIVKTCGVCADNHMKVYTMIDTLRTNGLGKAYLGSFSDCFAFFTDRMKQGDELTAEEMGLLITYYLFTYYSYAEVFSEGEKNER